MAVLRSSGSSHLAVAPHSTILFAGALALATALVAPPAGATDGVLEINQTCATQTGCFAGDTAGLPVTIDGSAGDPTACTPNTGGGSGVEASSSLLKGISVRNGSIRGMGRAGVWVGDQAEVRAVRIRSNRFGGIVVGVGSSVSDNLVFANGGDGIQSLTGTFVTGNTTRGNTGFGLNLGNPSGYRENAISGNTAGTVTGTGVDMGDNACNGLATCP